MKNKNQKIVSKFWEMPLYLPRIKDSLITTVGKDREIDEWFITNAKIIKSDSYSQVGLVETQALGQVYVKHYRAKSWWHRVAMLLNRGRPVRSFKMALLLSEREIPVPVPYGLITSRGCLGVPESSYYLCQALIEGQDLKSFYLTSADGDSEIIQQCMQCVGRQLAKLHNRGCLHGDCKWSNIFLQGNRIFFIDLDNSAKITSQNDEAKDLARFILNAEELSIGSAAFDCFISAYTESRSNASTDLMNSCKIKLEKLRIRHLTRYGERGERLMH